ncbi:MAG: hypothetical protein CMQ51_05585 [Gammaproteobacteria bacterium]|nr:hypothetical protein [Gammaproteobacteria bacterium]|tara:strand:+ start:1325 stop:5011 length:3687 start_codon:yes stop_codon:yes gene_type:complete
MGRKYTWAFINTTAAATATAPEGSKGSLQYRDPADETTFTGSPKLIYDPTVEHLLVTGSITASGDIVAKNYYVENIYSLESDGDSRFGNSSDDRHHRTGSMYLTGQLSVSGATVAASSLHVSGNSWLDGTLRVAASTNLMGDVHLGDGASDEVTFGATTTGSADFIMLDDKKLYFGTDKDASFVYDAAGSTDTLLYAGANIRISDDVQLQFGSDGNATIEYDEDGNDVLLYGGSNIRISDDVKLEFGDTGDFSMEYDEDGVNRLLLAGAGVRLASDQKLEFGDNGSATIEFDEDGTDELRITGATRFENNVALDSDVTLGDATADSVVVKGTMNIKERGTPTAPSDGEGGYLYAKTDGKLYWVSNEISELDLGGLATDADYVMTGEWEFQDQVEINQSDDQTALEITTDHNKSAIKVTPAWSVGNPSVGSAKVVNIGTDGITGGTGLYVGDFNSTNDKLGSGGHLAEFYSNSNNADGRTLVEIRNDSNAATATQCLSIRNDATNAGAHKTFEVLHNSAHVLQAGDAGIIVGPSTTQQGQLHVYSSADDKEAHIFINAANSSGARDPKITFAIGTTSKFTMGADDDDGDHFKIGTTDIDVTTAFQIDAGGAQVRTTKQRIGDWAGGDSSHPLYISGSTSSLIELKTSDNINYGKSAIIGATSEGHFMIAPETGLVSIYADGSDAASIGFDVGATDAAHDWVMGVDDSDSDKFKIATTNLAGGDSNIPAIAITSGSSPSDIYVGIGTAVPDKRLHVAGTEPMRLGEVGTFGGGASTTVSTLARMEMIANKHGNNVQMFIDARDNASATFQRGQMGTYSNHNVALLANNSTVATLGKEGCLKIDTVLSGPTDGLFKYYSDQSHNFYIDADNDSVSVIRWFNGEGVQAGELTETGGFNLGGEADAQNGYIGLTSRNATAGDGPAIYMSKHDHGGTIEVGDNLGEIWFRGTDDGTNKRNGAGIVGRATWGKTWTDGSSHPGEILLYSVRDGETSLEQIARISGDHIAFGTDGKEGTDAVASSRCFTMIADRASAWAGFFQNDGDNTNRWGLKLQCGKDDNSGGNYPLGFYDGNGTQMGLVSFTGGTVTYGPFTGDHYAQLSDNTRNYQYGEIVKIVSTESEKLKQVRYTVGVTTSANDPAVLGVYSAHHADGPDIPDNQHSIFAVGDGHILVCSEGGDISVGDYVCSSNTEGHGMKQSDDLLHNYTVAKASEPVVWSEEDGTTKLIACTYHAA